MRYTRYHTAVDTLYHNLDEFVKSYDGTRIVMFGISVIASMIVEYLRHKGLPVDFCIDNSKAKQGCRIFDLPIPVQSPSVLAEPFDPGTRILIASSAQKPMTEQLEKMGYVKDEQIIWIINLPELMNDFSHIQRPGMVPVGIEECKKEMVRTMDLLNQVCIENGLRYYCIAGTLIGVVRHKGFIPWDDDVDIVMPVKDIYRLNEILKTHPELRMVAGFDEEVDFFGATSQLFTERYLVDSNHFPMQYTAGMLIDVFPLIGLPGEDRCQDNLDYMEAYRKIDMEQWGAFYDREKCQKKCTEMFHYLEKYAPEQSRYVAAAGEGYTGAIVPYDVYGEPVWLDFEDIKVMAPTKYDDFLRKMFGDYMKLPPVEKRVSPHYYRAYKEV